MHIQMHSCFFFYLSGSYCGYFSAICFPPPPKNVFDIFAHWQCSPASFSRCCLVFHDMENWFIKPCPLRDTSLVSFPPLFEAVTRYRSTEVTAQESDSFPRRGMEKWRCWIRDHVHVWFWWIGPPVFIKMRETCLLKPRPEHNKNKTK